MENCTIFILYKVYVNLCHKPLPGNIGCTEVRRFEVEKAEPGCAVPVPPAPAVPGGFLFGWRRFGTGPGGACAG